MTKPTHQVFKRIVLYNKLLSEAEVDALLHEVDDPALAIKRLVEQRILTDKKGAQFLAVYHKQIDKLDQEFAELFEPTLENHGPPAKPPSKAPPAEPVKDKEHAPGSAVKGTPPAATPPAPAPAAPADTATDTLQPLHDPAPLPAGGAELIHRLLREARLAGASDMHVKAGMRPVLRLYGTLRELAIPPLAPAVCEQSLLAILNGSRREQFVAHDDLDFCYDGGPELGRFRSNLFRHLRGVDGVFRLISSKVPTFDELKLPETVKRFTDFRVGIVLITGPKGSGKTTTLAAMVDQINANEASHVITVEDPVEFVHPCKAGHVNQREVGVQTRSFTNALRASLREAPDVIVVGEMRDLETTSLAITAAEVGHLVLATLHTPDAVRTIGRILDVFPAKEQPQIRAMLSESLRGICSQLLLPNIDNTCLELAYEILINTTAIGHLIREDKMHQVRGLMQTGKLHGMVLMEESLIRLAKEGRIRKLDALAFANDVKLVERELSGLP